MIITGIILLIIGFAAKAAIIWTIGIIAVVVGAILAVLGMAGHAIGGEGSTSSRIREPAPPPMREGARYSA